MDGLHINVISHVICVLLLLYGATNDAINISMAVGAY